MEEEKSLTKAEHSHKTINHVVLAIDGAVNPENHESCGSRVCGQHLENTIPHEVVAISRRASHQESHKNRDLVTT